MPHQDLVILFAIWACMALVTLLLTQASLGPGYSIPHLGLTLTRDLWSHSQPLTKLVRLILPLGLTVTWFLSSTSGPNLDLVILVPLWSSP